MIFDKLEFWHDITELNECFRPRTNDIHNPTLRFMHRWIGITLFPRDDVRVVKNDDMRVLYVMVHKIHVSPVKAMVAHWLSVSERKGPIELTSLISRIVDLMGVLINNHVQYITTPRSLINFEYFKQGHMLKKGLNNSMKMIYRGRITIIPLPCADLWSYRVNQLTINLDKERCKVILQELAQVDG